MAAGVSIAAVSLGLSTTVRGAGSLALFDFRVAIGVTVLLALVAVVFYVALPAKTGADVSGHGK
jgi:uncharacterized membrane protein YGL010W